MYILHFITFYYIEDVLIMLGSLLVSLLQIYSAHIESILKIIVHQNLAGGGKNIKNIKVVL